jgi:ubiquinone/menaquinone biosynthesis C-methylase UbiE
MHDDKVFHAGHAHRLDDPERRLALPPEAILDAVGVDPGAIVADIGAGTGYFALALAERTGPSGRVYAVDLQAEMLAHLGKKLAAHPELPVTPVHARAEATTLADDSFDLVFFGSVWHELDQSALVLLEARRLIKTGGRIAIVDWRADATPPPGPPADHRQPLARVVKFLERERWKVRVARDLGPYTYLVVADLV